METTPYLFFHGGPGMNSFGDEAILAPVFSTAGHQVFFWNEPSLARPNGDPFQEGRAFSGWIDSAEATITKFVKRQRAPVHVIAHSFASNGIYRIAEKSPEHFSSLTLISPVLDFNVGLRNILGFAISDFERSDRSLAEKIKELRSKSQTIFDVPMQEALGLATQDGALFSHYWRNHAVMGDFFEAWQKRGAALDMSAFFCVMKEFAEASKPKPLPHAFSAEVKVIFGKHDLVSPMDSESLICQKLFKDPQFYCFESSAHFPHLEERDRFIEIMKIKG